MRKLLEVLEILLCFFLGILFLYFCLFMFGFIVKLTVGILAISIMISAVYLIFKTISKLNE